MEEKHYRRTWTPEETEFLRENWKVGDPADLKRILERSWGAIRLKARRMKLGRRDRTHGGKPVPIPVDFAPAKPPDVLYLEKELRKLRRLVGEAETEHAIVRAFLREAMEDYEPLPFVYRPPAEPKPHLKEEVAILPLADLHYGLIVLAARLGGLSTYSVEVFLERMELLLQAVRECVAIMRTRVVVNDLYIPGLGDWVEGEGVYVGQAHELSIPMLRQVLELGDLVPQRLLSPLCTHFRDVYFRGVGGNHGRYKTYPSNWDIDAMWHWKLRMEKHTNFHMHIEFEKLWTMFRVLDWEWNFFAAHGNQVRAWQGNFPQYGVERAFARYVNILDRPINYLFMGHHHQAWIQPQLWGANIFSGSFVGGSVYSHDRMIRVGRPQQWLIFMNRDHITSAWPLILGKPPQGYFDEGGIYRYVGHEKDEWKIEKEEKKHE